MADEDFEWCDVCEDCYCYKAIGDFKYRCMLEGGRCKGYFAYKKLKAENAELRATLSKMETVEKELRERLEKAVELPCIEPMTTWDWDANTGCGKAHFGKFWKVLYRDNDGEFIAYMGATKEEATAMLAELKGEKK